MPSTSVPQAPPTGQRRDFEDPVEVGRRLPRLARVAEEIQQLHHEQARRALEGLLRPKVDETSR